MKIRLTSNYTPSFIAFLDILGFKDFVSHHGFKQIKDIFDHIEFDEKSIATAMSRAADEDDETLTRYNKSLNRCNLRIMSDSIIVAAPSNYKESLAVVLDICNNLQESLYECDEPIFLRGAVAEGDFYKSDRVMFGQGLIDAYLAQENVSVYPRIIISDEVLEKGIPSVDDLGAYGYESFPKDKDGYHYINTLGNWLLLANCGIPIRKGEKYQKMNVYISKMLSGYHDIRVREKYLWLADELERVAETAEEARVRYEQSLL